MMEAVRTSETSVDKYFTRQYIPEDNSELHTRLSDNLKSHRVASVNFVALNIQSNGVNAQPCYVNGTPFLELNFMNFKGTYW
jgi:hypothetical protein